MSFQSQAMCQILVVLVLLASSNARAQSGGGYEFTKNTISGGGGTKFSGEYELSGTVGQHSAVELIGGDYALRGGFWSPSLGSPLPPTTDPSGLEKSRFISLSIPQMPPGEESALRVRLIALHHVVPPYPGGPSVPFTSNEGQDRWVGPPAQFLESASNAIPFHAARLQCTPHYQDWSTVEVLHVTGSAIVPSSEYEVENVAASCMGIEQSCPAVSVPLTVRTTRWADVEEPFNPPGQSAQPDLADVSSLVNKFRGSATAPIKARALLVGSDAFGNFSNNTLTVDLDFTHIAACVDAFRGKPYPYAIQGCP